MLAWIEIGAFIANNILTSIKKGYFSICTSAVADPKGVPLNPPAPIETKLFYFHGKF